MASKGGYEQEKQELDIQKDATELQKQYLKERETRQVLSSDWLTHQFNILISDWLTKY